MSIKMVKLGYFDGKSVKFPSKWLTAIAKKDFKMTLNKFVNEFYTYDTTHGLIDRAIQEKIHFNMVDKWREIRNDFFNEEEQCVYIDGYLTDDANEEGKVIAKVYVDGEKGTVYIDEDAEFDSNAQDKINEIITMMEGGAYQ